MAETQRAPVPAHEMIYEQQQLPSLRSNRGKYVEPSSTGWMRPTSRDTPVEEMRRRYKEDGYVWIKNLMPREDVYDMREHYFTHMSPTGLLLPNTSPRDGIFNSALDPLAHQGVGGTPEQSALELIDAAHATPVYRKFLTHPDLRGFVREFMGWEQEVLLKRGILRHHSPGSLSTGIHYDQIFLRGGEPEFLTAWVPIGDCTATGGGLMYLEKSAELGKKIEKDFTEKAKLLPAGDRISAFNANMEAGGFISQDADEFSRIEAEGKLRWLVGDYEAGDVVFHTPWMIHAATQNEDEFGRIRLASDLRFYEKGAALDKRWMKFFTYNDGL
ncbi:MAG: hypothetical protein Q9191_004643 [Dirinaria sp. TL-2023a]